MITELFDMFNRTHTGETDQDRKDFVILIKVMLTCMGSDLYTYMLMLERAGRKEEQALIKEYRDRIFGARDSYDRGLSTEVDIIKDISYVYDKLSTQITMLRTFEGREWEASLFQSLLNDIPNLRFHLGNLSSMKIPQRVVN